ncbi:MAG: HTH domain-containing protein [Candidatus Firestonebacteria bacterium]
MNSFKDIAYQILQETGKSLHSKEITKIALNRGWLKTVGKTPEFTMNAQLIVDINAKKEKSRFIKTAPSTFGLNPERKEEVISKGEKVKEKKYRISKDISSMQKGDIAEARIAELVTLYGDTSLSCYKPISDDEGIDLIVKEKGSLKTMYIQIKSRYGDNPDEIFIATAKASSLIDNYSMATVFCYFDTRGR